MLLKSSFPLLATALTAYRDVFGNPARCVRMLWFSFALLFVLVDVPSHFISKEIEASFKAQQEAHAAKAAQSVTESAAQDTAQQNAERPQSIPPQDIPVDEAEAAARALGLPVQPQVDIKHVLFSFALNLLQVAIIFAFAVALYRRFLLAEDKDKTVYFRFGKMEWDYSLTSVKAGFVLLPVLILNAGLMFSLLPMGGEPAGQETYAFLALGFLVSVYLQARLAMAYPLTVAGETREPVKKSWKMTGPQGVQIAFGNLLVVVPLMIVVVLFILGATGVAQMLVPADAAGQLQTELPLPVTLLLKSVGSLLTLCIFAVLTAFHARVYGFLAKSD